MRAKRNTRNSRKQSPSRLAGTTTSIDPSLVAGFEALGCGSLITRKRKSSGKATERCHVAWDDESCNLKLVPAVAKDIVKAYGKVVSVLYDETTLDIAITALGKDEASKRTVSSNRVPIGPLRHLFEGRGLAMPADYNVVCYRNCFHFVCYAKKAGRTNLQFVDFDLSGFRPIPNGGRGVRESRPYIKMCDRPGKPYERLELHMPSEVRRRILRKCGTHDAIGVMCTADGNVVLCNPSLCGDSLSAKRGSISMDGFRDVLWEGLGKHKRVYYEEYPMDDDQEYVLLMPTGDVEDDLA